LLEDEHGLPGKLLTTRRQTQDLTNIFLLDTLVITERGEAIMTQSNTLYVCFDCGYSQTPEAPNTHDCSEKGTYKMEKRNDSAFYTNESGVEVVWEHESCDYYVVRNGEMRIHATTDDGHIEVIRYTDKLEEFGITNDEQLAEWTDKGEEVFSWQNNSWFEVYTEKDPEFYSEPYHSLEDAIGQAQVLHAEAGEEKK
jgi:hypothetical protein